MARYLALSGATLNIVDLCEMDLVHQVASERPLLPLFRHLAQSPHYSELSKREQPRQVDIFLLEEALSTMAIQEPELLETVEQHAIWDRVLMVPPSATGTSTSTASNSSNGSNGSSVQYPSIAGQSWPELQLMESLTPELLLDASSLPGGIPARFEHIDAFVENCFGAKHDVKSTKKTLTQYVANLESQISQNHQHHMMDKRHASIAMQRKLHAAKTCLATLQQTDAAVAQTWFDLTRHAATKSFDDCLRDEITLMK